MWLRALTPPSGAPARPRGARTRATATAAAGAPPARARRRPRGRGQRRGLAAAGRTSTAGFVYVRLHGHEHLYGGGYSPSSLRRWAGRVRGWAGAGPRRLRVLRQRRRRPRAPYDALGSRPARRRRAGGRTVDRSPFGNDTGMGVRRWLGSWPLVRQLSDRRPARRAGQPLKSNRTREPAPAHRDRRPGRQVGLPVLRGRLRPERLRQGRRVVQIEGDPDSPVSRGRLCPKGSATLQLTTGDARERHVLYRRPHGTDWERARPRDGDGHGRRPGASRPAARPGSGSEDGKRIRRMHGHRQPRRRDAGQRGELPDQEAVDRARRRPGREPGAGLPQLDRRRAGHVVRARRRRRRACRPAALRLHRHRGLQHRRGAPGRRSSG